MKRFSEQLKKKSKNIRMLKAERDDLRARVVSYMEYHPMPKAQQVAKKAKQESIISEPFTVIKLNMTYIRSFVGVFTMMLIVGVPVVAERAVPGDVLYPVKVQFNEELRSSLAFSPYAKVEWETERLERRLAEARLLEDEGKLTDEIEAEVAQAVQNHSNAAQKEIATLRESDSDEAALAEIAFASALDVQSEVLESRGEKDGEEGRSVAALAGAVASARSSVTLAQGNVTPSFEKLLARIEIETTRAQELFTSVREEASKEEISNIERRLADIQRKVMEAIELHNKIDIEVSEDVTEELVPVEESVDTSNVSNTDSIILESEEDDSASSSEPINLPETSEEPAGVDGIVPPLNKDAHLKESVAMLSEALTDTQKLISFMTDIDVRSNVTIEELLPIKLTKEERLVRMSDLLQEVTKKSQKINDRTFESNLEEKFILGKEKLAEYVSKTEESLRKGDLLRAESLVLSANEIADDLLRMSTGVSEKDVKKPNLPVEESKASSTESEEVSE